MYFNSMHAYSTYTGFYRKTVVLGSFLISVKQKYFITY